jgi:hypothetical protein
MKPPIKAIKKIIKYCRTKSDWVCGNCELNQFCLKHFQGIPCSEWVDDYKELKEEVNKK